MNYELVAHFVIYLHSGPVYSLSLSFDGSLLISASEDGNCLVWDVASRQSLRKFESHKGPVTHVSCIMRPNELLTGAAQSKSAPMPWKSFKRTIVPLSEERNGGVEQQITDTSNDLVHQLLLEGIGSSLPCEMAPTNKIMDELRCIGVSNSTVMNTNG
jgi:pre-rRNA-processing protein IPI3